MGNGYDVKATLVANEVIRASDNTIIDLRLQFSKEDDLDKEKLMKLMEAIIDLGLSDNVKENAEVYPAYLK